MAATDCVLVLKQRFMVHIYPKLTIVLQSCIKADTIEHTSIFYHYGNYFHINNLLLKKIRTPIYCRYAA